MNPIKEAALESGAEETSKPIMQGVAAAFFASVVDEIRAHSAAILIVTLSVGAAGFVGWRIWKRPRQPKQKPVKFVDNNAKY